jgi:hypothetical protein
VPSRFWVGNDAAATTPKPVSRAYPSAAVSRCAAKARALALRLGALTVGEQPVEVLDELHAPARPAVGRVPSARNDGR